MTILIVISVIIFVLLLGLVAVYKIRYDNPQARGKRGENRVANILQLCCVSEHDRVLNDTILYNPQNDNSSQIDHILILICTPKVGQTFGGAYFHVKRKEV